MRDDTVRTDSIAQIREALANAAGKVTITRPEPQQPRTSTGKPIAPTEPK